MARGINFQEKDIIGHGCFGTVVYRGRFRGQEVAVKRIMVHNKSLYEREVDFLTKCNHPNVLRLLHVEKGKEFWYLTLELCSASLTEYCDDKYMGVVPEEIQALKQMAEGLAYIHSQSYVHRDIKPSNILIFQDQDKSVLKIADFGFCKPTDITEAFSISSDKGSMGWIAPEIFKESEKGKKESKRVTTAIDVFSLGCVFYYFLTKGKHPFGRELERTNNILHNKPHLTDLDKKHILRGVIKEMIQQNPDKRPKLNEILTRPVFNQPAAKSDRDSGSFWRLGRKISSSKESKRNSKEVSSNNDQQNPGTSSEKLETSPKAEELQGKYNRKKFGTWTFATSNKLQGYGSLPKMDSTASKNSAHDVSYGTIKATPTSNYKRSPSSTLSPLQPNGKPHRISDSIVSGISSKQPGIGHVRKISTSSIPNRSIAEKTIGISYDSHLNQLSSPKPLSFDFKSHQITTLTKTTSFSNTVLE